MSRGEQQPKKSREEKTPVKSTDKKPTTRELDESELDGIAGGAESAQKGGVYQEERQKTLT